MNVQRFGVTQDENLQSIRKEMDLLFRGHQVARMLRLVADHQIPDCVPPEGQIPVADLAAKTDVLAEPLLRILRALAWFEIFSVSADGLIGHTERSRLLRRDAEKSLYYSARFWPKDTAWQAWSQLDAALTGQPPIEAATGKSLFALMRENPEESEKFHDYMSHPVHNMHQDVTDAYDFSQARVIADIGGGKGELLRAVLPANPGARGVLFDQPSAFAELPHNALLDGRITLHTGDFFQEIPGDADLFILCRILHDWSDEHAHAILTTCRKAIAPGTKLLVIERMLEPDPRFGEAETYLLDVQMMAVFDGAKERTRDGYDDMLAKAGFRVERVIPTASVVSIIEAVAV